MDFKNTLTLAGSPVLTASNYSTYAAPASHLTNTSNPHSTTAAQVGAPSLTGTGASGTWSISITGNAATTSQTTWSTLSTTSQLNAQGNQASGIATATGGLGGIMVQGPGGATGAFMSFHRPGIYAAYFGLDTDNQWKVGGWSAGAAASTLLHTGNIGSYTPGAAAGIGASQDLNAYTTPGFYCQTGDANAISGSNYPVANAGSLLVQQHAGRSQLYITYPTDSANMYFRSSYLGTWGIWKRVLDSSNYSGYALPLRGGTITGNIVVDGSTAMYEFNDRAGASYPAWVWYANIGYCRLYSSTYGDVLQIANRNGSWGFVGEGWTAPSLQSPFSNYGYGYATAGYWRDSLGVVHLRGLIAIGGLTSSTPIFTLPAGYRPELRGIFSACNSATGAGRVDVATDGVVYCMNNLTSGNWISLDGITFRAYA